MSLRSRRFAGFAAAAVLAVSARASASPACPDAYSRPGPPIERLDCATTRLLRDDFRWLAQQPAAWPATQYHRRLFYPRGSLVGGGDYLDFIDKRVIAVYGPQTEEDRHACEEIREAEFKSLDPISHVSGDEWAVEIPGKIQYRRMTPDGEPYIMAPILFCPNRLNRRDHDRLWRLGVIIHEAAHVLSKHGRGCVNQSSFGWCDTSFVSAYGAEILFQWDVGRSCVGCSEGERMLARCRARFFANDFFTFWMTSDMIRETGIIPNRCGNDAPARPYTACPPPPNAPVCADYPSI